MGKLLTSPSVFLPQQQISKTLFSSKENVFYWTPQLYSAIMGFFQVENPIVYSSFCNGFPTFLSFPNPTNKAAVM